MRGVAAGDVDFYLRHVDSNNKTNIVSYMVITSKTSEEENQHYKSFRMFDVSELNDYYKCSD